MSSQWEIEPESGRYFYWDRDQYGAHVRVYQKRSQNYEQTPRSHSRGQGPRRPSSNTQGGGFSSRNTASNRDQRGSEYPEQSDPIPIYTEPPSHYSTPAESTHLPSGSPYPIHHASPSYHAPGPTWVGSHADSSLAARMDSLTVGEGSGSTYTFDPPQHTSVSTATYVGNSVPAQWDSMTQPGPSGFSGPYQDNGKSVARDKGPIDRHYVVRTEGEKREETLDKSYKVRNHDYKKWFRPGRVFSTLWTDALGLVSNEHDSQFMSTVSVVQYGERVYSTIRRFVVVRFNPDDRACVCLPVTTYAGKGIEKRGITLNNHGQIFSGNKPPSPVAGVEKEPLRVRLANGARELDRHSYINYGRPYTVQTNVKVKDVGELDSASRRLLRKYYKEVSLVDDDGDFSDAGPPRTAEDRAAILTGMGGAVTDTPGSYGGAMPSAFDSLGPSTSSPGTHQSLSYDQHASEWTGGSGYIPPRQSPYVQGSGYASHTGPPPQMATSSITYSNSPVYEMRHTSSASGHQPRDNRFIDSSTSHISDRTAKPISSSDRYYSERQYDRQPDQSSMSRSSRDQNYYPPVASISSQYSSAPVVSSSSYPVASPSSARAEPVYEVVEEVVVLPTLEEARASTSRRYSTTQYGGSVRSNTRDRGSDRDRGRDREPHRDQERGRDRKPEYNEDHDWRDRERRRRN